MDLEARNLDQSNRRLNEQLILAQLHVQSLLVTISGRVYHIDRCLPKTSRRSRRSGTAAWIDSGPTL
jgi:hypothetical protein